MVPGEVLVSFPLIILAAITISVVAKRPAETASLEIIHKTILLTWLTAILPFMFATSVFAFLALAFEQELFLTLSNISLGSSYFFFFFCALSIHKIVFFTGKYNP